jgi:hypothetical protein
MIKTKWLKIKCKCKPKWKEWLNRKSKCSKIWVVWIQEWMKDLQLKNNQLKLNLRHKLPRNHQQNLLQLKEVNNLQQTWKEKSQLNEHTQF